MRRVVTVSKMVGLLLLVSAAVGQAQTGCWNCSASWIVGSIDERCSRAGDGQTGAGTDCGEYHDGWGWICYTSGELCYNVDVNGGGGPGGGGGLGGGGESCTVGSGEVCPAECSRCTRVLF